MTSPAALGDGGAAPRLKITEIFFSLQGEAHTVGFPTVFVRLTGCPLRCQYCDTAYAFHGGTLQFINAMGTRRFVERSRELAAAHGARFEPAQGVVKLAAEAGEFAD